MSAATRHRAESAVVWWVLLAGLAGAPAQQVERVENSPRIQPRLESAPLSRLARTPPPFARGFELAAGDVVAFTGGSGMVMEERHGYLETLLTLHAGDRPVHFRNLAWQADTVYLQQRPRNFGTQAEMLARVGATVVIAAFGQMEAMEGEAGVADFLSAYERLLDEYATVTPRIVVITPRPFESPAGPSALPDLTRHNQSVRKHAAAIRRLAAARRLPCVDLAEFGGDRLTSDGMRLTAEGHWQVALEKVRQLTGTTPVSGSALGENGRLTDGRLEALRQAVQAKNELWQRHWRPANWAFAYGNRMHVPSSHDHRPGMPRWFPAELAGIIPLIGLAEQRIDERRQEVR